jgi:hypothetical protein
MEEIQQLIAAAFRGVVLGGGISLRQAQVIDRYGEGVTDAEFDRLPLQEITNDWSRVPLEELERDCVAHLDAEGYRYYIPAFMLSVLKKYDSSSMRVIGTLGSLYPKKDMWAYHMGQYAMLNQAQLEAIASYVSALPSLVPLDGEEKTIVPRALRNYWGQFVRQ